MGVLSCYKMDPGYLDESGRCTPVKTSKIVELPADTVISAIGNKSSVGFIDENAKDVFIVGAARNKSLSIPEAITF